MNIQQSVQYREGLIDVTDSLLSAYTDIPIETFKRNIVAAPKNFHPQAPEMFVYMSAHMGIQIEAGEKLYEDYCYAVNCLVLSDCLASCELSETEPSFDSPNGPDPWVKSTYTIQIMDQLNREQSARIHSGMWKVFYDFSKDTMHACLTKKKRASVLMAIDNIAKKEYLESLLYSDLTSLNINSIYYAFSASPEYLSYITSSEPDAWKKFEEGVGFIAEELEALSGFLVFLEFAANKVKHSFWYDDKFLTTLCDVYSQAWPEHGKLLNDRILDLVSIFSLSPLESSKYLLPIPFYKLHGRYLRNPSFTKYQNIMVGLLTIAIRKNENLWSRTLGSTLAKAADRVADSLPTFSHIKVATRKKFPGGDIDLALYDKNTGHMFAIEVKTVYDKHRVDSLSHRYVNAKVNVPKAVKQLRETGHAIDSGGVLMRDIFGEDLEQPKTIHYVLLTWFDAIDLTIGSEDEDILSLNFCLLRFLLDKSQGNLLLMAESINELRNIWLVSKERDLDLGQPDLTSYLEVQLLLIDRKEELLNLGLSSLTKKLLEYFVSLSDIDDDRPYISYMQDTKQALRKTIFAHIGK
ncbi:MAG: hypothetical protein PHU14_05880 [Methylovulum sp.]|nr:hypothetical protein [Methylovulum sp.]